MLFSFFRKRKSEKPKTQTPLEAYNSMRPKEKTHSFCHAPASNLYFDRRGRVVACCHNRTAILGYYPQQSISEIWNGDLAKTLRNKLEKNDLSMGCGVCENDLCNNKLEDIRAHQFDSFELNTNYPVMMEFELSNVCNLECAMCIGELSSSIRKNRDKLPAIKSPYDAAFLEQLNEFLPHLKETRFSGGEPFLIRSYFKIWKKLLAVNPNCLISVQTNGTQLNEEIKEIMEAGRFEIGISLDSMKAEIFEDIRKNADYTVVEKNIQYFADYCKRKGTTFRLATCVMPSNWSELPALINYANDLHAYVSFHQVLSPKSQSLWALSPSKLQEIYDYLASFNPEVTDSRTETNKQHYLNYIKQIQIWIKLANQTQEYQEMDIESMEAELMLRLRNSVSDYAKVKASEREQTILSVEDKIEFIFSDVSQTQRKALLQLMLNAKPIDILETVIQNEKVQLKALRDQYADA